MLVQFCTWFNFGDEYEVKMTFRPRKMMLVIHTLLFFLGMLRNYLSIDFVKSLFFIHRKSKITHCCILRKKQVFCLKWPVNDNDVNRRTIFWFGFFKVSSFSFSFYISHLTLFKSLAWMLFFFSVSSCQVDGYFNEVDTKYISSLNWLNIMS